RGAKVRVDMHQHVGGFRRVREEFERPVRVLLIRDGRWLQRVDHIRKLNGVSNEEDGQVVADEIPIALIGVEFDGKSVRIAKTLGRSGRMDHGGEADEYRSFLTRSEQRRLGELR